ncbi:MAG: glycosyl transferase [Actinomycetota bacterium]
MRYVWAVVAFVLATLLIGAGIAQRTVFMGPSSQEVELSVEEQQPFVLIDGSVLRTQPGVQTLLVRGEGDLFAAYGRTADLEAWLADASYNEFTLDAEGAPRVEVVGPVAADDAPDEDAPAEDDETTADDAGEETEGRNPAGSDLWLDSFTEQDLLVMDDMQLPDGVSVLLARDGVEDAPDDIVVSWPLDTSTPFAGPLMAAGAAMLLAGLVLYVLAIRHQRRGRGPRRKGPGPMPPTQPIDLAVEAPEDRAAITAGSSTTSTEDTVTEPTAEGEQGPGKAQRSAAPSARAPRRRMALVLPALGLSAVMMAGCSSESWPQVDADSPTPTPSPTVIAPENQKPPAVTESQASRILQSISTTLVDADAELDIDLAETRLDGSALEARRTDYELREELSDRALPATIPTDDIEVLLPQATESWPRTVLLLSKSAGDESVAPVIMTMTQQDPWSNYRITNMAEMQASAEVPTLAPAWLGTTLVTPDSAFLTLPPQDLATAFADVVDEGEDSESYDMFDEVSLELASSIQASREGVLAALDENGASETSKATFDITPSEADPVAMATLDSGAIVAVSLIDSEKVTPTSDDAVIKFGENPEAETLTGVSEASKGVVTTYELQLFFSVPTQGSTEQIRLLAAHQDLLDVKVIK